MESEHYYHFATKGLEEDILFGSVEEFIAGMNRIPGKPGRSDTG